MSVSTVLKLAVATSALGTASILISATPVNAVLVNGEFELEDLNGWTQVNQPDGSGRWVLTPGGRAPISRVPIPRPTIGAQYVVTDQAGPGSHVLFQDIVLEANSRHTLSFDWFAQNTAAGGLLNPGTMDYSGAPNQQFRVDLVPTSFSDWFGPSASNGILANILAPVAQPYPVSSFSNLAFDLTPWAGSTVRVAFRAAENRFFFEAGVDNVRLSSTPIPEPGLLISLGLVSGLGVVLRRRVNA
jgi:hypothetical protein